MVVACRPIGGLGPGSIVSLEPQWNERVFCARPQRLAISSRWLGRIVDPEGQPLDGLGPLYQGDAQRNIYAAPPEATRRARVGERVDLGVSVLNIFTPLCHGQRLGVFSGSGVGKSTLLAMLTRYTECDVAVVALVGERGREVREFIEDELGTEGLARSVVVVATSDSQPLLRRGAAYAAITIAEYFRDQGKNVLLLMDSVSRFCLALREIALSTGEPPASRGYPPSVFAELPLMLERAGPGLDRNDGIRPGQITALFTVLVEGDDHNEPVADAVRGILDGHIKLDRLIAEAGRYPAVDVLGSLSRMAGSCLTQDQSTTAARARAVISLWKEMGEMVRLGVYRLGSDPAVDDATRLAPKIEAALCQAKHERFDSNACFARMKAILEQTVED